LDSIEVKVLREILNGSLKIPLSEIADSLHIVETKLLTHISKFSATGLLTIQKDCLFVDKDKRRFFEAHIQKFDEDFEPNLPYLLTQLNKLPMDLVFEVFSIPRTADSLASALI